MMTVQQTSREAPNLSHTELSGLVPLKYYILVIGCEAGARFADYQSFHSIQMK